MALKYFIIVSIVLFTIGCGGSSDSSEKSTNKTFLKTGYLIDSYVEGVDYYINGNLSGTTDKDGKFKYQEKDTITFKVGQMEIATIVSVYTDNHVTIQDLCEVRRDWADNSKVVNIATFLQSLDEDSNPSNGITITSEIKDLFIQKIKLKDLDYSEIVAMIKNLGKNVKSKNSVVSHLKQTMQTAGITPLVLDENTIPPYYETKVGLPPLPTN